ncbi:putative peptidoglycan binding protein [Gracilaria domingensis]|nr:putative peptidoglycan binding protein [Gracilaria domingensis]
MDAAQYNVDRILQSVGSFLRDIGANPHQGFAQPPQPPPMPSWTTTPPPFRHPPPPPRHHRGRHHRRRRGEYPYAMFGRAGLAPFFASMFPMMAAQEGPNVSQSTRDAFEQLKNAVLNSDNTNVAFQAARNAFPALRNWLIANLGQSGSITPEAIDSLISTVERSIRPSVGDDITNRTTHLLRTALNDAAVVEILRKIPWNMDFPFDVGAEFESAFSMPDNNMPFQTHVNVECDNCDACPIVGVRYQATNRDDYDLCCKCYEDPAVSKEGIEFKKLTYLWEASLGDLKAPNAPLSLRSRGPSVAFLQKLLTDLGYMNESMYSRVVGMYGPRTRNAVSQFQREYGLDGTAQLGVYDDITAASMLSMMEAQVPPTAAAGGASTPTPDSAVPPNPTPDLPPAQG